MIKTFIQLSTCLFILINSNSFVYSHPGHAGHEEEKKLPYERLIHVQNNHWKIETNQSNTIKVSILDKNFKPLSLDKLNAKAEIKTRKYKKEVELIGEGEYLKGNIDLSKEKSYQIIVSLILEGKNYKGTFIF